MLKAWTALGSLSAMANYFLHVKILGRGKGSKVTKAAAYRAGERIHHERTSTVMTTLIVRMSLTRRSCSNGVFRPGRYGMGVGSIHALECGEHAGRQWNSRLAREILVHVPPELTPAQRTHLVRAFARLADRYRNAVDFAIHVPRAHADHRLITPTCS